MEWVRQEKTLKITELQSPAVDPSQIEWIWEILLKRKQYHEQIE